MRRAGFDSVETRFKRANRPGFGIGNTVVVTLRIVKGEKERVQTFEGEVIARKGAGLDEMFTVRRQAGVEGVERTFPVHSPKIAAIKVRRYGRVRRAKLYYLRARVSMLRKLRESRFTRYPRLPNGT
jgi:large subunit ribosomal protein L19